MVVHVNVWSTEAGRDVGITAQERTNEHGDFTELEFAFRNQDAVSFWATDRNILIGLLQRALDALTEENNEEAVEVATPARGF